MGRIRVLDEAVVNKIAAGEVVERPASVVKELAENALDAGASHVTIYVEGGGKRLMRVTDDGAGMSPEDAVLAVQSHTTSKISSAADLASITTLGFRGEALASIAAVSLFSLVSCERGAGVGTAVALEGGQKLEVAEVGAPSGTTVTVRHLFFNTPARLKFMRGDATELARMVDTVGRFSLSHPDVSFVLFHNDTEVFRADAGLDLPSRVALLMGRENAERIIEVAYESPLLTLRGWVSRPERHRSTRGQQYFFVNCRSFRSSMVAHALERAYETLLPAGRHPLAVLFIEMDPRLVDPNVHPTKAEVRFTRESEVYSSVFHAVREALLAADVIPAQVGAGPRPRPDPVGAGLRAGPQEVGEGVEASDQGTMELVGAGPRARPQAEGEGAGASDQTTMAGLLHPVPGDPTQLEPVSGVPQRASLECGSEAPALESGGRAAALQEGHPTPAARPFRVIGQSHRAYVLVESGGALLIIDQHAAHERILYDRLMRGQGERRFESQGLVVPVPVEFSAADAAVLRGSLDSLAEFGLVVEPFGGDTFLIRSVPVARSGRSPHRPPDPERFLRDLVEELRGDGEFRTITDLRQRLAASMACHAAVKQNDPLTHEEMEALVHDLLNSEVRHTCPHSRPAIVSMSTDHLERQFHRR